MVGLWGFETLVRVLADLSEAIGQTPWLSSWSGARVSSSSSERLLERKERHLESGPAVAHLYFRPVASIQPHRVIQEVVSHCAI